MNPITKLQSPKIAPMIAKGADISIVAVPSTCSCEIAPKPISTKIMQIVSMIMSSLWLVLIKYSRASIVLQELLSYILTLIVELLSAYISPLICYVCNGMGYLLGWILGYDRDASYSRQC